MIQFNKYIQEIWIDHRLLANAPSSNGSTIIVMKLVDQNYIEVKKSASGIRISIGTIAPDMIGLIQTHDNSGRVAIAKDLEKAIMGIYLVLEQKGFQNPQQLASWVNYYFAPLVQNRDAVHKVGIEKIKEVLITSYKKGAGSPGEITNALHKALGFDISGQSRRIELRKISGTPTVSEIYDKINMRILAAFSDAQIPIKQDKGKYVFNDVTIKAFSRAILDDQELANIISEYTDDPNGAIEKWANRLLNKIDASHITKITNKIFYGVNLDGKIIRTYKEFAQYKLQEIKSKTAGTTKDLLAQFSRTWMDEWRKYVYANTTIEHEVFLNVNPAAPVLRLKGNLTASGLREYFADHFAEEIYKYIPAIETHVSLSNGPTFSFYNTNKIESTVQKLTDNATRIFQEPYNGAVIGQSGFSNANVFGKLTSKGTRVLPNIRASSKVLQQVGEGIKLREIDNLLQRATGEMSLDEKHDLIKKVSSLVTLPDHLIFSDIEFLATLDKSARTPSLISQFTMLSADESNLFLRDSIEKALEENFQKIGDKYKLINFNKEDFFKTVMAEISKISVKKSSPVLHSGYVTYTRQEFDTLMRPTLENTLNYLSKFEYNHEFLSELNGKVLDDGIDALLKNATEEELISLNTIAKDISAGNSKKSSTLVRDILKILIKYQKDPTMNPLDTITQELYDIRDANLQGERTISFSDVIDSVVTQLSDRNKIWVGANTAGDVETLLLAGIATNKIGPLSLKTMSGIISDPQAALGAFRYKTALDYLFPAFEHNSFSDTLHMAMLYANEYNYLDVGGKPLHDVLKTTLNTVVKLDLGETSFFAFRSVPTIEKENLRISKLRYVIKDELKFVPNTGAGRFFSGKLSGLYNAVQFSIQGLEINERGEASINAILRTEKGSHLLSYKTSNALSSSLLSTFMDQKSGIINREQLDTFVFSVFGKNARERGADGLMEEVSKISSTNHPLYTALGNEIANLYQRMADIGIYAIDGTTLALRQHMADVSSLSLVDSFLRPTRVLGRLGIHDDLRNEILMEYDNLSALQSQTVDGSHNTIAKWYNMAYKSGRPQDIIDLTLGAHNIQNVLTYSAANATDEFDVVLQKKGINLTDEETGLMREVNRLSSAIRGGKVDRLKTLLAYANYSQFRDKDMATNIFESSLEMGDLLGMRSPSKELHPVSQILENMVHEAIKSKKIPGAASVPLSIYESKIFNPEGQPLAFVFKFGEKQDVKIVRNLSTLEKDMSTYLNNYLDLGKYSNELMNELIEQLKIDKSLPQDVQRRQVSFESTKSILKSLSRLSGWSKVSDLDSIVFDSSQDMSELLKPYIEESTSYLSSRISEIVNNPSSDHRILESLLSNLSSEEQDQIKRNIYLKNEGNQLIGMGIAVPYSRSLTLDEAATLYRKNIGLITEKTSQTKIATPLERITLWSMGMSGNSPINPISQEDSKTIVRQLELLNKDNGISSEELTGIYRGLAQSKNPLLMQYARQIAIAPGSGIPIMRFENDINFTGLMAQFKSIGKVSAMALGATMIMAGRPIQQMIDDEPEDDTNTNVSQPIIIRNAGLRININTDARLNRSNISAEIKNVLSNNYTIQSTNTTMASNQLSTDTIASFFNARYLDE